MENFERTPSQEWKEETEERKESIASFLKEDLRKARAGERHYSDSELHYSGSSIGGMRKLEQGAPDEVGVFYEKGEIKQIHILYESKVDGNLDVYLTGKALEDYLKGLES